MNLRPTKSIAIQLLLVAFLLFPAGLLAQGSIYGTVQRSDLSISPDGAIRFFGFVGGTDNEIRFSGSTGAGFDAGNWFDFFPNFLYAPPLAQYEYHFFDTLIGQFSRLNSIIPSDSYLEENIQLTTEVWPGPPTSITCMKSPDSTIELTWSVSEGLRTHIYRRAASSNGSFYRIDDPSGNLSSGLESNSFIDSSAVDGELYSYIMLANDASGTFSPPTEVIEVSEACCGLYTNGYTGDVTTDTDGKRNLADITRLIDRIYVSKTPLWCESSGNVSGDVLNQVNLVDITRLIDHVFVSKEETALCQ